MFALFFLGIDNIGKVHCQSQKEIVDYVNNFRMQNQAPNVSYSLVLEQGAQGWANYLATIGQIKYSSNINIGESVSILCTDWSDWQDVIYNWYYNGGINYDYNNGAPLSYTRDFTQLVWVATTQIGIGVAYSTPDSCQNLYVVLWYSPIGNIAGQFLQNVLPPKSTTTNKTSGDNYICNCVLNV